MDLESRARTIQTYVESVESLSEYYEKMGPRVEDIDRAIALWGDRLPVVVEIGCGTGRDAQEILKRTPYYVGFDVSSGMVERARATVFGGVVLQNDLRYAFARDTKTINGEVIPDRVDIIFAFASLLHSDEEEIEGVLQDALQVLTTGGIFYFSLKADEVKIIK